MCDLFHLPDDLLGLEVEGGDRGVEWEAGEVGGGPGEGWEAAAVGGARLRPELLSRSQARPARHLHICREFIETKIIEITEFLSAYRELHTADDQPCSPGVARCRWCWRG